MSLDLLKKGPETGLRPGERVPSNLLCWSSPERSARLTELLDERVFTAVLIDPRDELEPCAVAVTAAIEGAGVRCDVLRLTGAEPAGEADAGTIPAPSETFESLASDPRLLIVRPDGYVGCRAPAADAPASVERYFAGLRAPGSA